ncbi:hypothetical protein MANES_13G002785v8 [Manihot esculenta]|uniref:Uncharacterized protein n=1 Tax=Manihot esculenta TaxID=3983 RepID=A0A2C9UMA6_MANES|nr:hypothetical protein MANES_13G002785v8 [Manihot esculenta]
MNHLRLLILRNASIFHGLEYLSNELRYLEWHEFPFNSLPSAFQPSKLVELHMHHSNLKQLWEEIKLLKVIDLSYSKDLIKTLDFRNVPNLEVLNLEVEGCTSLVEVDRSIVLLTRLVWLNLKGCEILETLPSGNWNLKSLKILNLCGCLKLSKLPEGLVSATSLEVLDAAGIGSGQMTLAKACDLHSNYLVPATRNQKPLAFAFSSPQAMMKLVMSYCAFPQVLNNLSCLWSLGKLNLCGNHVLSIPSSINQLCNLTDVDFSNCRRLESLPALPCNIERLSIGNCTSLQALPDMAQLSKLTDLWMPNCRRLKSLPTLPPNIGWLFIEDCTSLQTLPDLVQLFELINLVIYNCSRLESLPALPSNVESINMQNCTSLQTLPEMVQLCRLASLRCTNYTSLQLLPDLPSNVQHLYMENCTALKHFTICLKNRIWRRVFI